MKAQNQFIPSQTNIIYDIDSDEIHVISKLEELNDWEIVEVSEKDFDIVVWKCKKKKNDNKDMGEFPLGYNPYQE